MGINQNPSMNDAEYRTWLEKRTKQDLYEQSYQDARADRSREVKEQNRIIFRVHQTNKMRWLAVLFSYGFVVAGALLYFRKPDGSDGKFMTGEQFFSLLFLTLAVLVCVVLGPFCAIAAMGAGGNDIRDEDAFVKKYGYEPAKGEISTFHHVVPWVALVLPALIVTMALTTNWLEQLVAYLSKL